MNRTFDDALTYMQNREFDPALKICTELLESDADNVKVRFFRGQIFYALDNYREAQEDFEKICAHYLDVPQFLDIMGKCCYKTGEFRLGIFFFRILLRGKEIGDGRQVIYSLFLSACLLGNKEHRLALKVLSPLAKQGPRPMMYAAMQYGISLCHLQLNEIELCKENLEIGFEHDPDHPGLYTVQGFLFSKLGLYENALGSFEMAAEALGDPHLGTYYRLQLLEFLGRKKEAAEATKTLLANGRDSLLKLNLEENTIAPLDYYIFRDKNGEISFDIRYIV